MDPKDFKTRPHFYQNEKYTFARGASTNRKRQIIDQMLAELHEAQMDMIDQAVEYSDLRQAQEVIDRIRSL
jgi:hypothetical protein